MDRTPQHQTERSRRLITGVTLVAAATVVAIATAFASSDTERRANHLTFANPNGVIETFGMEEADSASPFSTVV